VAGAAAGFAAGFAAGVAGVFGAAADDVAVLAGVVLLLFEQAVTENARMRATGKARSTNTLL
jgi:hypothetical protein